MKIVNVQSSHFAFSLLMIGEGEAEVEFKEEWLDKDGNPSGALIDETLKKIKISVLTDSQDRRWTLLSTPNGSLMLTLKDKVITMIMEDKVADVLKM